MTTNFQLQIPENIAINILDSKGNPITSLQGPVGPTGATGATGATGKQGPAGATGPAGPTGASSGSAAPAMPTPTRLFPGSTQQVFPADYYFNSRVDGLPLDPFSAMKMAALGVGRLGTSPEFILNEVTGSPVGAQIAWGAGWNSDTNTVVFNVSQESDGGNWPIGPSTNVSLYAFGQTGMPLATYSAFTGGLNVANQTDSHILVVNTTTGMLYETYALFNNVPPYQISNGAIWDCNGYALRSAAKLIPYGVDSDGLTSADAAGMPIWPLCMQYAEVASGAPILHGFRFCLTQAMCQPGYQWPATHQAGGKSSTGPMLGTCFRLNAAWLAANKANFPASFQPVLTAIATFGLWATDFSDNAGLISMDADQGWGDPNSSTSYVWGIAGLLHDIPFSALEIVDNQARMISVLSGQVNQNFVAR